MTSREEPWWIHFRGRHQRLWLSRRRVKKQFFTITSITTILQVLFSQDMSRVSILKWDDPQYTIFDPQPTSQIIAEIDFELNSEARLTQSQEEDVSLESQKPQCLKTPESVTASEREAHSLTHMPFRSWCTICQRAKGQHQHHKGNQKLTSVIQLDHSFYKVPGETQNIKVLTFVETITSMSGAVIVPDVSKSGCRQNTQEVYCCQRVHKISSTMWRSFRTSSSSRTSRSGDVIAYSDQSSVQSSISRDCWTVSQDVVWSSQINQDWACRSSQYRRRSSRCCFHAVDHSTCDFSDQSFLSQIRWEDLIWEGVQEASEVTDCSFWGTCSRSHSVTNPSSKVADSGLTSKVIRALVRQGCHHRHAHRHTHGWSSPQVLRTRTITRLTREDQFKLEEFKKFKIAVHESSVVHKEDSYDQMLFKDLVRKFLLQQRNQVTFESSESDSRVIHSPDPLQESSSQGAPSVPSGEGANSSDQGIPHPPGLPQPFRRRITGKQPPSEFEINMITSLKQGILEINEDSVNSDQREEDQELQLLQDLRLQEWYQGDLQGYSEKEVKEAIKKELVSLSSVGHEVYDPVPLNLLSSEDQAKIIESRWVIGPRSGQLKARFVGKGYTQVIDKESNYAHTPQATTLKIILLMSQIHKWSLCVCVRCGLSISQYTHRWIKRIHSCSGTARDSTSRANCLEAQTSALWSQRFTEIMASSFESSPQKPQGFTNEVRSMHVHRYGF